MSCHLRYNFTEQLKQTGAVLFYIYLLVIQPFTQLILSIVLASSFPAFCVNFLAFGLFSALYLVWYVYDFNAPKRGSRFNEWVYKWPLWTHLANFFPVEVVKTAEIPPDRNYILSAHPHGILGSSSTILFATDGVQFSSLFPGIKVYPVTLSINFWIPLRRELILAFRMISSDREAIEYVLSLPREGNAIGMAPGGAAEALESHPGSHRCVLANRKGFIKLAIKHGASLVPIYHFGETDLYNQVENPEGSFIRKIQNALKWSKCPSFPLAYGQSQIAAVLPPEWIQKLPTWLARGLIPYRRKVVTVVGAPMHVERDPSPSDELVDRVHAEYCRRLRELFDAHKVDKGGLPESAQIEFV